MPLIRIPPLRDAALASRPDTYPAQLSCTPLYRIRPIKTKYKDRTLITRNCIRVLFQLKDTV